MAETITGTLRHGLKIGDAVHRDYELREATTADYFAAEEQTSAERPLTFNAALLCRQLVRVGTYEGPFTLALIGTLTPKDFEQLRLAQQELDRRGEGG